MPGGLGDSKTHLVDKEETVGAINLGFKTVSHDILKSKLVRGETLKGRGKTDWKTLLRW